MDSLTTRYLDKLNECTPSTVSCRFVWVKELYGDTVMFFADRESRNRCRAVPPAAAPHNGRETSLNGRVMQNSTNGNLISNIPQLVEFVSRWITLEPGAVIATGIPPDVGSARTPPVYLGQGDTVEVEIERIGVLGNTICRDGGAE